MRSTSKQSAATLVVAWNATLSSREAMDFIFARELFMASRALHQVPAVASALADSTRDTESRVKLVDDLFGGKISDDVHNILHSAASLPWSADEDLVETVENLGIRSVLYYSGQDGRLNAVEDELHQVRRVLTAQTALRVTLSTFEDYSVEARQELARNVFSSISEEAQILLAQAVQTADVRPVTDSLVRMIVLAAKTSNTFAAAVWSATELTEEQKTRLASALSALYKKKIVIYTTVDPTIVGGLKVQCGSEVIDASLLSRINNVREKIVGGAAQVSPIR